MQTDKQPLSFLAIAGISTSAKEKVMQSAASVHLSVNRITQKVLSDFYETL